MPDSFLSLRSLAQKFLLTHRCGREEVVGLRFKYHPTSDPVFPRPNLFFSPHRLPPTIVPSAVADEAPFLVPEAFFLPTSDLLLFFRPCSQASGPYAPPPLRPLKSCPVQCISWLTADLQFCHLKLKQVLARTNQADFLWIYRSGGKV